MTEAYEIDEWKKHFMKELGGTEEKPVGLRSEE